MSQYPVEVQSAIDENRTFSIREAFSGAFDVFKERAGGFIGFTVILFLTSFILNIIPFLGSIASMVITPVLYVGYAIAGSKVLLRQNYNFGDFFEGFEHIGQLFSSVLIQIAAFIGLALVFGLLMFLIVGAGATMEMLSDNDGISELIRTSGIPLLLLFIVFWVASMCIFILWMFSSYLIVFYKMNAWDAMVASRKIIQQRLGKYVLLLIAGALTMVLGFVALFVGIFVAIPIVYLMMFIVFEDIVGLPDTGEQLHSSAQW